MDKEQEDVRAFHKKFDILNNDQPTMLTRRKLQERIECMQEELDEFKSAVLTQDFPEQADALIDLVYFAKGTAVMMGLPWEELWNDVQRANMEKVRGVGKRGHSVDMVKPEGWTPPNGLQILSEHGYDIHNHMTNIEGVWRHDESKCDDDAHHKQSSGSQFEENPPSLMDLIARKICSGSNMVRGPNMREPVDVFNDKPVAAMSRMVNPSDTVYLHPNADGKTLHMYEVIIDEVISAETFEKVEIIKVRYGVSD